MPFPVSSTHQCVFFTTNKKSSSVTPLGRGPHHILSLNTLKAIVNADYYVDKLNKKVHAAHEPPKPAGTPNPLYMSQDSSVVPVMVSQ